MTSENWYVLAMSLMWFLQLLSVKFAKFFFYITEAVYFMLKLETLPLWPFQLNYTSQLFLILELSNLKSLFITS